MNEKIAKIIDGKAIALEIAVKLTKEIEDLKANAGASFISPKLAIIMVGNNPSSQLYINNKISKAKEIGIDTELIQFEDSINTSDLVREIKKLNEDKKTSGIIVQLPLPAHINKYEILSAINPIKDVDGFHPHNIGKLYINDQMDDKSKKSFFTPCTALGCLKLIEEVGVKLEGKNLVIIGRSNIVGKPLAALLNNKNCTVTLAHSKTVNLKNHTQNADIIVSAIGKANFFDASYFKNGVIIIDVGINKLGEKTVGDVDFESVKNMAYAISPVPGGVGPMTVIYLLANCLMAYKLQQQKVDF